MTGKVRGEKSFSKRGDNAMPNWTTDWPTEPGWYWTYQQDHYSGDVRPAEVKIGGTEPHTFIVRIRDGCYLHREEHQQRTPLRWTELEGRPKPPTPSEE